MIKCQCHINFLLLLNKVEYHIYDIIDEKLTYQDRYKILSEKVKNFTKIKLVETKKITNEQELKEQHSINLTNNYEGSILRTINGLYKCDKRSSDLLKYKDFIDSEYTIVDFTKDKDDCIIWICKSNDITFNIRPKGTKEERSKLYTECCDNFKYKNKNLWVKYFELTNYNVPRFPTTMRNTVSEYIRQEIL